MKSQIFHTDTYKIIEDEVIALLNSSIELQSGNILNSPRAAGDAIEGIISQSFGSILGDISSEYSAKFARRSMADLAFTDTQGLYYIVDVKTHRSDTKFNMPNLTSVERLARLYEDDTNYFTLLMVKYEVLEKTLNVTEAMFALIEFIAWDCLTIGALGWGQIQIANSNHIIINHGYSRKTWMLDFCDAILQFYPREISKIHDRVSRFENVRSFWQAKPDD